MIVTLVDKNKFIIQTQILVIVNPAITNWIISNAEHALKVAKAVQAVANTNAQNVFQIMYSIMKQIL